MSSLIGLSFERDLVKQSSHNREGPSDESEKYELVLQREPIPPTFSGQGLKLWLSQRNKEHKTSTRTQMFNRSSQFAMHKMSIGNYSQGVIFRLDEEKLWKD